MVTAFANTTAKDVAFLADLVEAGRIRTVLDRSWPLERMAEAHRFVEFGEKSGGVVIDVVMENAGQPRCSFLP